MDEQGCKVIKMDEGNDSFKKIIPKSERELIKTLIFDFNDSWSETELEEKDANYLINLPNLEAIEFKRCLALSLAKIPSNVCLNIKKFTVNLSTGVFLSTSTYGVLGMGNNLMDYLNKLDDLEASDNSIDANQPANIRARKAAERSDNSFGLDLDAMLSQFPLLEEIHYTNLFIDTIEAPEELYVYQHIGHNFVPILRTNNREIVFKKVADRSAIKYHVLPETCTAKEYSSLEGVYALFANYFDGIEGKIVVPSSVCYIFDPYHRDKCSLDYTSIFFEESEEPIFVEKKLFDSSNRIDSLVAARPFNYFDKYPSHIKKQFQTAIFKSDVDFGTLELEVNRLELYGKARNVNIIAKEVELFGNAAIVYRKSKYGSRINPFEKVERIFVPAGKSSSYEEFRISNKITERVDYQLKAYNIKMDKPGTILSELPLNELKTVSSLTITGMMYETDVKVLNDCKNLKYLDLSNCIIMYSPEAIKEQESESAALSALFALAGAVAKQKYYDKKLSTSDYLIQKGFSDMISASAKATKSEKMCIVPKGAFSGLFYLEEVKLPVTASKLEVGCFSKCPNLKKVTLPKFLEEIEHEAFYNCTSLAEVEFPKTLNRIQDYTINFCAAYSAFGHCPIKKVDLSHCNFEYWSKHIFAETEVEEIHLPEAAEFQYEILNVPSKWVNVYLPQTMSPLYLPTRAEKKVSLHFKSKTPPRLDDEKEVEGYTIHCPKGSLTAYYATFGSKNEYIEE